MSSSIDRFYLYKEALTAIESAACNPERSPCDMCIERALGLRAAKDQFEQSYRTLVLP
jgi:hypothetical protein